MITLHVSFRDSAGQVQEQTIEAPTYAEAKTQAAIPNGCSLLSYRVER